MPTRPPTHRPAGWRPAPKRVNPAHRYYGTAEWKRLREFVRKRDRGICAGCGITGASRVDHIVARDQGGADAPFNLRLLCANCDNKRHREKGFR